MVNCQGGANVRWTIVRHCEWYCLLQSPRHCLEFHRGKAPFVFPTNLPIRVTHSTMCHREHIPPVPALEL